MLPFKVNLKGERGLAGYSQRRDVGFRTSVAPVAPAHSLHHVCDQTVRDAWEGLLCQAEGVLQFLNGSYTTTAGTTLVFQLVGKKSIVNNWLLVWLCQWVAVVMRRRRRSVTYLSEYGRHQSRQALWLRLSFHRISRLKRRGEAKSWATWQSSCWLPCVAAGRLTSESGCG